MNTNDQKFIAQKIRTQYMESEPSELEALRALDAKVKRPVNVFSYVFGSISALIMGGGMSLVMTELPTQLGLGDMMVPGIAIGVLGLVMALLTYPMHKRILENRRKRFAPQIIALSDEIVSRKEEQ
ncbi:MAG: dihydropteridine reductase [Clostridia bacterium]|nr:dihydropteridine reductase [Clostridia bacterium]